MPNYIPTCVTSPALIESAQRLALTGRPILGRPATIAGSLVRHDRPGLLLVTDQRTGRPVGLAAWEHPGPSRRIQSAILVAVAVAQEVDDTEVTDIVAALACGVGIQFEYSILRVTRPGDRRTGYVAADIPRLTAADRAFVAAGWTPLQPQNGKSTVRFITYVGSRDPEPVDAHIPVE